MSIRYNSGERYEPSNLTKAEIEAKLSRLLADGAEHGWAQPEIVLAYNFAEVLDRPELRRQIQLIDCIHPSELLPAAVVASLKRYVDSGGQVIVDSSSPASRHLDAIAATRAGRPAATAPAPTVKAKKPDLTGVNLSRFHQKHPGAVINWSKPGWPGCAIVGFTRTDGRQGSEKIREGGVLCSDLIDAERKAKREAKEASEREAMERLAQLEAEVHANSPEGKEERRKMEQFKKQQELRAGMPSIRRSLARYGFEFTAEELKG